MALQKQVVTIPALGLDTHADPKSAAPGSFDVLENVVGRRTAGGGIEWRKRLGTTSRTRNILGGGTISNARKMAKFGNEELVVTDTKLYSWSSIAGAWVDKGNLTPIGLSTVPVTDGLSGRYLPDMAIGGGYVCEVNTIFVPGSATSPVYVTVMDTATGDKMLAEVDTGLIMSSGAGFDGLHVIALSTKFLIFAYNGGVISAVSIAYSAPSTISGVTVVANNGSVATARWDIVRNGTADQVLIAYNGDAANRLRAILWNSGMTSAGAFLFAAQPDRAMGWLTHDFLDGKAYLAFVSSATGACVLDITIAGFAAGAATVLDGALLQAYQVTGMRSAGANTVFAEVAASFEYNETILRSTGGAFANWQLGKGLWSRVFKVGSTYYVGATYADGLQDKYFVLDASGATPKLVAQALDGLGLGLSVAPSCLVSVPAISPTVVAMPINVYTATLKIPGGDMDTFGVSYLRLDFAPTLGSPKRIGETLLLPGASVRMYDGEHTTQAGFPVFPVVYNTGISGGGSITALSSISFIACYFWLDASSQKHLSSPSAPVTITLTGVNNKMTFRVSTLRIGDKLAPAYVNIYATTNGGTTYTLQQQIENTPATDYVAVTLSTNPTTTGEELYTTGRALPHNAYPPASLIEVWGDRAFLAQTDEPNQLWVSDEIESGTGLSFSQANVLPLPSEDGEVSTINEFDDRLVIGKLNGALYPLSGSGPAANGDGQYQTPSRINSVVGPIGPNGVIKTSAGLIFTSNHGRYLLPRGRADPVRLAKVEGYDSLTVTGASNVDGFEQTRLVTSSGRTLVYHYGLPDEKGLGPWSTFTGQTAVDCANFGGAWCYLSSDGTVHVEVAGQYADDGVAFTRTDSFSWINGGGTFANIRLYAAELLVDVLSSCTITASLAYDYNPAVVDTDTKAVTVATIGLLEVRPSTGRMNAIHIAFSETSTGEGYRLSGIALEIGAKPGFAKQAAGAFLT